NLSRSDAAVRTAGGPGRTTAAGQPTDQSRYGSLSRTHHGLSAQPRRGIRFDTRSKVRLQADARAAHDRVHRAAFGQRQLLLLQFVWANEGECGSRGHDDSGLRESALAKSAARHKAEGVVQVL